MELNVVQDNLREIAIVSGGCVAAMVVIFVFYKKFTKPSVRGARKSLKQLVKFLNSAYSDVNTQACTLAEVSLLIVDRDILWKGKK